MPNWKPEVLNAFDVLNIDIDVATVDDAAKAYKIQAIRHHPDKNTGDPSATQRFQKIGAAWDVCQKHFANPEGSYVGRRDDDDGLGVDPEDLAAFFMFMFEEMISGTYRRGKYRSGRRGSEGRTPQFVFVSPGIFGVRPAYSSYSPNSYRSDSYSSRQLKQDDGYANEPSQAQKKAAYEKRLREFELEIAAEQREIQRQAKEKSKDENRRAAAYQQAFQAARTGKASMVISLVQEYDLDVNGPEKMQRATAKTKPATNYQTLLHAACRRSDEGLIIFLLDKGADPQALNDAKLHPFHVAIACGNVSVVSFFLLRRVRGGTTPGCHPSKAAPDGRTPLQIALAGGNAEMVALMTKEATVHDVERCWLLPEATHFKDILSEKKGFVDPDTKELQRQEAEQKAAEIAEKARIKKERADKAAAEKFARQREEEEIEEQRRMLAEFERLKREAEEAEREKAELKARQEREAEQAARRQVELEARQKRDAEEAARRKIELEARQKREAEARQKREAEEAARRKMELEARQKKEAAEAARRKVEQEARQKREAEEARRRAEHEARMQAEAEVVKQAAEARVKAEAQARKLAEEQERARRQADEEARLKTAAKAEAKRLQREAEAAAVRQEAEAEARRQAAVQAEALRIAAAENARLQQVAAQEAERNRRAAVEQQKLEAKRAETMRRLQGQAEENRRLAEAKVKVAQPPLEKAAQPTPQVAAQKPPTEEVPDALVSEFLERRKIAKFPKKHDKHEVQDVRQLSPEALQKRAAQSARDRARMAEEREKKRQQLVEAKIPDTPERMQSPEYIPPTPVSMPSPSQRRMSPPLVPHHTRPNLPARMMDPVGLVMLSPEDIQTGAIPDDLFAVERPKTVVSEMPFRGRGGRGIRARGRGRGRGGRGVE
ncbi:hypothetical protein C8F04DRAFT_1074557 [Mycena alexandri]|uniref:J domain-containing protein n=1 Tax=Mycena alexandri TaxID=1745969 RepID=A0AAD6XCJ5_9AGAR|nr:hypothetical protein C8F04DRAFT_1074557 [Mycena alexandri]